MHKYKIKNNTIFTNILAVSHCIVCSMEIAASSFMNSSRTSAQYTAFLTTEGFFCLSSFISTLLGKFLDRLLGLFKPILERAGCRLPTLPVLLIVSRLRSDSSLESLFVSDVLTLVDALRRIVAGEYWCGCKLIRSSGVSGLSTSVRWNLV